MYEKLKGLQFGMKIKDTVRNTTGYLYSITINNSGNILIGYRKTKKFNYPIVKNEFLETNINSIEIISKRKVKNSHVMNSPEQITIHKFNIGDIVFEKMYEKKEKYIIIAIDLAFQGAITYNILHPINGNRYADECMIEKYN